MKAMINKHAVKSGISFGVVASIGFYVLPPQTSKIMASILIGVMGGVYWGFSLCHGKMENTVQETIGAAIFMYIAASILDKYLDSNPQYIGIGIACHGVYDLLIQFNILPYTKHAPRNYGLACAIADFIMGAVVYLLWRTE